MSREVDHIIRDLITGNFRLTKHANERMAERRIRFEDIRRCAETVKKTKDQGDGKYLIVGNDFDGDEIKVVAAWEGETVVITLIGD
jgi:hypothetical protein